MFSTRTFARALLSLVLIAAANGCSAKKITVSAPEKYISSTAAFALAIDDDNLYWTDGNRLVRTPVDAPEGERTSTEIASGEFISAIVLDDTTVYWIDRGLNDDTGKIMKAPKSGGSPSALVIKQPTPSQLAVEGSNVYWTSFFGQVRRVSIEGGEATQIALGGSARGIVVDDAFVYWTDWTNGTLMKTPIDGGSSTTISQYLTAPGVMTSDGKKLYWVDYGTYYPDSSGDFLQFDGQILSQEPTEISVTPVARQQQLPRSVFVSDGIVFWINDEVVSQNKTYAGSAMMATKKGVVKIADGQHSPGTIVARNGSVYWTNSTGVMRSTIDQ